MSESKAKKKRTRRYLDEHPFCYFCGGARPAITVDHVPPRACFPDGFAPEGFESPACKACNQGADKQDQIFGLYAMMLDFDPAKFASEDDRKKISKLIRGIRNNYPEALPDLTNALPINQYGSIITPEPVALSIKMTPTVREAIETSGAKLMHALYYRKTGKFLTENHQFFTGMYQPQQAETTDLTKLLASLLPERVTGERPNIKENYGDRFRYMFGYKDQQDFFLYAGQFGHGIVLWGIACREADKPTGNKLSEAPWMAGGCGPGSKNLAADKSEGERAVRAAV
jgi:hypothetical protein